MNMHLQAGARAVGAAGYLGWWAIDRLTARGCGLGGDARTEQSLQSLASKAWRHGRACCRRGRTLRFCTAAAGGARRRVRLPGAARAAPRS